MTLHASPAAPAAPDAPAPAATLAGLALCAALPALSTSITHVALPTLATAFDAPFGDVRWVVLAYLLSSTLSVVAAGRIADRHGRRPVLMAGVLVFVAGSAACALAPTLPLLVAARALQGLGAAAMLALAVAAVGDAVPRTQAGRAMGLIGTVSAAGTALGPGLGAALLAAGGWPAVFWVPLPAALLAFGLVARTLPAGPRRTAAAAGPLWQAPALRAGLAMNALVAAVMMASLVVGPFYLAQGQRLGTAAIGLVMTVAPAVAALAGLPAGRWVDRVGAAPATAAGLAAMALACAGLVAAPRGWGVVIGYALPLALLAGGYALFQAANQTAVMAGVPAERRGVVSGWMTVARHAGFVGGAWGLAALYALGSQAGGTAAVDPAAAGAGLRLAFAAALAATLAALALALRRRPARPRSAGRPGGLSRGRPG